MSHVEADTVGYWWADRGPVDGPVLGPFTNRSEAFGAGRGWVQRIALRLSFQQHREKHFLDPKKLCSAVVVTLPPS
jgi:hypothetical protein